MKKIVFLFICMGLFISTAHSQLRFGARGGLSTSNVSGNNDNKDVTGFFIGPSMEAMIDERFGIEASVMYSQKGIKFDNQYKQKTSYIEVPVNLKVAIPVADGIKPFLLAGPYVNFKISGDQNFDFIAEEISNQWKTKGFSAGLNFGVGIELFTFLQVGVNYGLGLTDNYKRSDGNYSVKDRTWSAVAAVYF